MFIIQHTGLKAASRLASGASVLIMNAHMRKEFVILSAAKNPAKTKKLCAAKYKP